MRFLVCLKNTFSGVTYHRLTVPFRHIEKLGHQVDYFTTLDKLDLKQDFSVYDALVFNRGIGSQVYDFVLFKIFKDLGKKVIMDIDDYWEIPETHPIRWRKDLDYLTWKQSILDNMTVADEFWTSTPELKTKIRELFPDTPIILAKNAIDYNEDQWKNIQKRKKSKKVRLSYIGSDTHHYDLDALREPMKAIHKAKYLDVEIAIMGFSQAAEHSRIVWQRQAEILSTNGRYKDNLRLFGGVRVTEYANFYNETDISIACVAYNEFNSCKSELKILESGSMMTPIICSDFITYSRTEANIDLCTTPQEWFDSIRELSLDYDLRCELGEELHNYVRDNYVIEVEAEKRLAGEL